MFKYKLYSQESKFIICPDAVFYQLFAAFSLPRLVAIHSKNNLEVCNITPPFFCNIEKSNINK